MFITRLRRKTQIRKRKGGRETLAEDAVRFQDIVGSKTRSRGVAVPTKLMRELQRGSEQQDGGRRLYKLDLRRTHLTDVHVEALAEALQELPVVRKLDFRGNDDLTVRTMKALNSLLKGQVELFRLVQADASLADSSLSFLYSVKLDPAVLSLDRAAAKELEAHTAALEVADSVLDVRHAFFEADIRESGTLTEHELSDAMRIVMGSTPKAGETSRVLRFFGDPGSEGRDPTVVSLGGFEAAMVGRLRESHTLPVLPQGCDELLFGSREDKGGQENPECFSPWSTRSFGATTGGIRDGTGIGEGGGGIGSGGVGHKRSPLSASQDFRSAAGMRTHVSSLPPWRGGEAGSELDSTQRDNEGGEAGREGGKDVELENIFDDDGDHGTGKQDASPRSGAKAGRTVLGSGDGHGGKEVTENSRRGSSSVAAESHADGAEQGSRGAAAENKWVHKAVKQPPQKDIFSNLVGSTHGGGHAEDPVLTEGSSDGDSSCNSPGMQIKSGKVAGDSSRLWSDERPKHPSEKTGVAGLSDWRRHSSGPTPTVQRHIGSDNASGSGSRSSNGGVSGSDGREISLPEGEDIGGRRMSDTPRIYNLEVEGAGAEAGLGASTSRTPGRRRSNLKGNHGDADALRRCSIGRTGALASGQPSLPTRRESIAFEQQSPYPSDSLSYRAATDGTNNIPRGEKGSAYGTLGSLKVLTREVTRSAPSSSAEAMGGEEPQQRGNSSASPPVTPDGGQTCISAGQAPPECPGGEARQTRGVSFDVDSGDTRTVAPGTLSNAAAAVARDEGRGGKDKTAGAHAVRREESCGAAVARRPSIVSPALAGGPVAAEGEATKKDVGAGAQTEDHKQEHEPATLIGGCETSCVGRQPGEEKGGSLLASASRSLEQRPGERHPSATVMAAFGEPAKSGLSPRRSRCGGAPAGTPAGVPGDVVSALAAEPGWNAEANSRGDGSAAIESAPSDPNPMPVPGTHVLVGREDGDVTEERRNSSLRALAGAMDASSLETISEGPAESSSVVGFDFSGGGGARSDATPTACTADVPSLRLDCGGGVGVGAGGLGGAMRKPYCLSPTNVTRQVQVRSDAPAVTGASCRERERLAARIQLSADNDVAAVAAAAPFANAASRGNSPGLPPSISPGTALGAECSFAQEGGGESGDTGSRVSHANDVSACPPSAERKQRGGGGSPEHGNCSGGRWRDGPGGGGGFCSPPSRSSRFHLPSSETKTAPLCGVGGSTSLYEGSAIASNRSIASVRGGGREAWCFSKVDSESGFREGAGMGMERVEGGAMDGGEMKSSMEAVLRENEEKLAIRLNEGALVISRGGLAKMGVILDLEAVQERGRDSLIGLQTLVLSCNRLQVLDISVLATMPSLRHLDVSHNLLCRMEPIEGRDLPPRLETLNMGHNRISRIGGIGHCFLLRVIDLRNNRIKRVQGLEHLSLLEQLDLGNNLISKAVSARALSFNRSLKLLWLGGNPLARHPRYRPTLTCLLPHVRSIDSRGMPPSSDSEQRRWTAGVLTGEEGGGEGCHDSGVGSGGGFERGGGGNSVSVSREWQAEQDERRSKEWRQMMDWRNDQALRDKGAVRLASDGRPDSKQAVNAARQRRQAKELARPRARTCPSEEVISKAKEVASHRPAVVFGISYRGEKDRSDDYTSSAAYLPAASLSSRADAPPSPPAHGRHHQRQERLFNTAAADGFGPRDGLLDGDGGRGSGDGGNRERLRRSNVEDNRGAVTADEAMLFGNACGGRELMMLHRDDHESRQRSHQEGGEAGASALPPPPPPSALLSSSALMPPSSRCSSKLPTVGARNGYDGTSSSPPASATVVADKGRERIPRTAQGGPGGGGAASAEQSEAVPHKQNQVVDSWLLDVRLETETAGTALRVLLRMCKERGRDPDGEQRRLSSFRTALDGMGLFSPQHGPMPTTCGGDEDATLAHRVATAARKVAMTKAAVKNLLRLMQSVGPGEDGSAELDQYAEFLLQQREIMIGGDDNATTPGDKRDSTTAVTAAGEQSQSVEHHHSNSNSGQERQEKVATGIPPTTGVAAFGNPRAGTGLLSSPVLVDAAAAVRDPPARAGKNLMTARDAASVLDKKAREKGAVALETKEVGLGQHQASVMPPDGAGLLAVRCVDGVHVRRAIATAAPASSVVAVDAVSTVPPGSDAVVPEATLVRLQENTSWEAKNTELSEAAVQKVFSVRSTDRERDGSAEEVGENGRHPAKKRSDDTSSLVSAREPADPDGTPGNERKGEGKGDSKEGTDKNGLLLQRSIARSVPLSDVVVSSATASSLAAGESSRASVSSGGDGDSADAKAALVFTAQAVAEGGEGGDVLAASAAAAVATGTHLSARERLLRHLRTTASPRSVSDDDSSCSSVGGVDAGTGDDDKNGSVHQPATVVLVQDEQGATPAQEHGSLGGCDVSPAIRTARGGNAAGVTHQHAGRGESGLRLENPESEADGGASMTRLAEPQEEETRTRGGGTNEAASLDDGIGEPGMSSTTRSTGYLACTQSESIATFESNGAVSATVVKDRAGTARCDGLDMSASDAAKIADKLAKDAVEKDVGCGKEETFTDAGSAGENLSKNVGGLDPPGAAAAAAAAAAACDRTVSNGANTIHVHDQLGGPKTDNPDTVEQTTTNDGGKRDQHSLAAAETARPAEAGPIDVEKGSKEKGSSEAAATGAGTTPVSEPEGPHTETGRRCSATGGGNENAGTKSQEKEKSDEEVVAGASADGKTGSGGDGDSARGRVKDKTDAGSPTAELEWIEGYDPGHDCYYYHHVPTGESRWYKPDEPYEPYVHSDEEDDDLVVRSLGGDELTAGSRKVTAATDAAADEDDDRRRDRKKNSEHSGKSGEKRHRKRRSGLEEEEGWEAEAIRARSSSSRRDKHSSTARRRSSQSSKTSRSSRRQRGDADDASARTRSGSARSSRQHHEKTALERLNDLTDENTAALDDLRSDDSGGRKGRRNSTNSSRRRDSRGSRRHRGHDDDDRHRSSRKRHGEGGDGDGREKGSRRGTTRGHSSSRKSRRHDDEDDDLGSQAGRRPSASLYSKTLLSSDGSVSSGGRDGGDRKRGVSSVRGGSRGG